MVDYNHQIDTTNLGGVGISFIEQLKDVLVFEANEHAPILVTPPSSSSQYDASTSLYDSSVWS